jgi:hypothetical protein
VKKDYFYVIGTMNLNDGEELEICICKTVEQTYAQLICNALNDYSTIFQYRVTTYEVN